MGVKDGNARVFSTPEYRIADGSLRRHWSDISGRHANERAGNRGRRSVRDVRLRDNSRGEAQLVAYCHLGNRVPRRRSSLQGRGWNSQTAGGPGSQQGNDGIGRSI
jgi:hypothetical protein